MLTIKLPYKTDNIEYIALLQKQYSSLYRYCYNRFIDGLTEKEIRLKTKSLNNVDLLDSWIIQSCIKDAESLFKRNKDNNNIILVAKEILSNI